MALLGRDTWVKGPFPGGVEVLLETFRGEESMGRPYSYGVGLLSHDPALDAIDLLGKPLSVGIKLETGGQRFFHGIVSGFAKTGATKRYVHYQATLRPLLGVLENTLECRIFNTPSQTALDVVTSVLDDCHITDLDATALSDHTYLAREYCLQYRESSFNLVQRLLEEEGIYYFFAHSENKHVLVLADAAAAHKTVPGYESVLYASKEEKLAEEHFWDLRVRRRMYPGRHTVLAGYQPTELRPKQLQFGHATSEDLATGYEFEHYDYPGGLFVPDEAEREARLRTEERATDNTVVEVEGNTMGLGVGDLVSLRPSFSGAVTMPFWSADDFAKQYLVVRASYSISIDQHETGKAAQADQPFRARYWLSDANKPYRAPRLTRKPVMTGPQTAVVVGPDREEIWTDQYGRVCVQFDWDRQGKHDELSSCWMRVSSGFAGGRWGEVHIPRIGHEVLVRFLDGDPDRPIIAGELYNVDNLPPYPLPANKTQSGTKSRSSKKGTPENFNEIRFEDLKGKEELHTQAEKNMSTLVKDSQTLDVGHDRKIAVGHDEKNHVTEERALTVGADDKVTVLGNHDKTVVESVSQTYHGKHTRTVHGDQKLLARKNKDEHVGLVHKLTTDQKFQLNQSTTGMTFESTNATVASAAGEIISFAGGATFSIDETGLITLDSPLGVTLTCGPSSLAITPAGVVLSAPSVTASAGAGATMGMGDSGVSMNGKKVIIEADGVCKIDGKKKIKLQESEKTKGKPSKAPPKDHEDTGRAALKRAEPELVRSATHGRKEPGEQKDFLFQVEFDTPTGGDTGTSPIRQMVNVNTGSSHAELGADHNGPEVALHLKATVSGGPLSPSQAAQIEGKRVHVRATFGKRTKRSDVRRLIADGVEPVGDVQAGTVTLDGKGTAVCRLHLPQSGGEICKVQIGSTDEYGDATKYFETWRQLHFQISHPANLSKPSPLSYVASYEEMRVAMVEEEAGAIAAGSGPAGSWIDGNGIEAGFGRPALVIGCHNEKAFHRLSFRNRNNARHTHFLICDFQFDAAPMSAHEFRLNATYLSGATLSIPIAKFETDISHPAVLPTSVKDGKPALRRMRWRIPSTKMKGNIALASCTVDFANNRATGGKILCPLPTDVMSAYTAGRAVFIRFSIQLARGPYNGSSTRNLLLVAAHNHRGKRPEDHMIQTMVHEVGHALGMVAREITIPGIPNTKTEHGRWYMARGHDGDHCAKGVSASDYSGRGDLSGKPGTCVMFGERCPTRLRSFCDLCQKLLLPADLKGYLLKKL
jgi:type VI secretion system secreted protein VgrG